MASILKLFFDLRLFFNKEINFIILLMNSLLLYYNKYEIDGKTSSSLVILEPKK